LLPQPFFLEACKVPLQASFSFTATTALTLSIKPSHVGHSRASMPVMMMYEEARQERLANLQMTVDVDGEGECVLVDSGTGLMIEYMQGFMCPEETSARDLASEETSASIQCELIDNGSTSSPLWKCAVELVE